MAAQSHVKHPLEPVFSDTSRILLLGTMPSPKSRELGFYYMHPQNRFWKVMAALTGDEPGPTVDDRKAFLSRHGIALWDVLAACDIEGASDASIRNARPNDLAVIMDSAPIELIATTGTKAAHYFDLYDAPLYPQVPYIALPSPSSANARMRLDDLIAAYEPLRPYLK